MKPATVSGWRAALLGAILVLTLAASRAETLVNFPLNEGAGITVTDTVSGLEGRLGISQVAETDTPVYVDDAPSGAAGDRSIRTQGNGFLMANDSTNKILNIASGPITMETWINIDPNFGRPNEGFGSYGGVYKLGLKSGELVWTLLGVRDITNSAAGAFPVGVWTHVAAVWEPAVGVTFYINGQPNFVASDRVARQPLHNVLSIGSEGTGNNVTASHDRFRIHSALLTAEQLDSVAATPKPVYESTRVAYNFNEAELPAQSAGTSSLPAISSVEGLPLLTGPAWSTSSPTGRAADFSLAYTGQQRLTAADPNDIISLSPENGNYTLQAWVNIPQGFTPAARMIVFSYEGDPGFSLSVNNNLTLHTTTFGKMDQSSSAAVPNDGNWHHLAVVHEDGVEFRFYVDGSLKDTRAYTLGPGVRTNPTLGIGSSITGGNPFTGMIDRVIFSNHALAVEDLDYPAIPGAPAFTLDPVSKIVTVGSELQLTVAVSGQPPLAVQWRFSPTGSVSDAVAIAGATGTTLTIPNVAFANQGIYFATLTNAVGEVTSGSAKVLVQHQPSMLTDLWTLLPGSREYLTETDANGQPDNLQRGMAYNPTTGNLLIGSRIDSPTVQGIYRVNAQTGAHVGEMDITGLSGGTIALIRIGVADDGAIYAANFGTFSDTNPLKIYRWENETAAPTLAYSGNPATGLANQQWGKNMDVRGSGANTQIIMETRNRYIAIFTTTDGENFQPTLIETDAPADAFSNGLAFGLGDTFWGKRVNGPFYRMRFDVAAKTATVDGTFPLAADTLANFDIDPSRGLLSANEIKEGPDSVHIYSINDVVSGPVLLDIEHFDHNKNNVQLAGSTIIAGDLLISLNTNNGIEAWRIGEAPATRPSLSVQQNGENLVITWPGAATEYVLEATPSLTAPNWQTVPSQLQDGQHRATVPTTGGMRFFRLRQQ